MFTKLELQAYCSRHGFGPETVELIESIRSSPPVRTPQGGHGNVLVLYPSRKMQCVIKAESHKVEFAFIQEHEYSDTMYEYYDQPRQIRLAYRDKNGHVQRPWHVPDCFCLGEDGAGFGEYKPAQELQQLALTMPNRYRLDENGRWICPPGEEWAAPFGLYYRVRSSDQINWAAQCNWLYLEDYYRRLDALSVSDEVSAAVVRLARDEPGIMLGTLRRRVASAGATMDDLHTMIVMGRIYVDLNTFRLADADRAPVYHTEALSRAFSLQDAVGSTAASTIRESHAVVMQRDNVILFDGVPWTIINVGTTEIALLSATSQEPLVLDKKAFEALVSRGTIIGVGRPPVQTSISAEGRELLNHASPANLAEAVRRAKIIKNPTANGADIQDRTIRKWRAQWRDAQLRHGSGLIGLLSQRKNSGRGRQIDQAVIALIHSVLDSYYDTYTNRLKRGAYGEFLEQLDDENRKRKEEGTEELTVPSERTFYEEARRHLPAHAQALTRSGPRGAYPFKEFYHEEAQTLSRHGDHAWQIAYLDHVEVDLQLRSSSTGKHLGKAWLSLLVGGKTRSILAYALSFDPPSYRSCMLIIRDCVRRHGRLPQIIVVDNGPEFKSIYFEALLATHEITIRRRPRHEPRYGAVIERLFGTMQTEFIYHLLGNTQLAHKGRKTTKATDPCTHARWTLAALAERIEQWAFHEYDTIVHPALALTPREAYALSLEQDGERAHLRIPYDDDFILSTYATTRKGSAKVNPGRGVTINYVLYWCEAMRDAKVEGTQVPVRYDPFDISVAYAYVKGQWRKCRSDYSTELVSCSERERMLIADEIRKQQRILHGRRTVEITQKKLAEFRRSNQQTERILEQQFRDLELRSVLTFPVLNVLDDYDAMSGREMRANVGMEEVQTSQWSASRAETRARDEDQPLLILERYL